MTDLDYMKRAYALAVKGRGKTSPNPMVGALIVKGRKIIGDGWHKRCGGDHAEIIALKKAKGKARSAKLYVTLEPCFHHGRTSPCVDAIIKSGISEVIIGTKDPNPLTRGKSIARLKRARIKTKVGFLESELKRLNEPFIKYIKHKVPFVVAKTAQTIDGKIATESGDSKWITSSQTRRFSRILRNNFDAILVGIDTVLADNPGLNAAGGRKALKKVVLDSSLKLSLKARLFKGMRLSDCIVATTKKSSKKKIQEFRRKGVQVLVYPAKESKVSLKWLLRQLAKQEVTNVLIEGGAKVVGSALNERVVDKMHIFIAPKILGDQSAINAICGRKVSKINQTVRLSDIEMQTIGCDLFIEGKVCYKN